MTNRTSTFITLTLIALLSVSAIGEAQEGTWTKKADMPTARWLLSTNSPVVNGRIYVIGGTTGNRDSVDTTSIVEAYDPVTGAWTRKTDMPTPRWGLATSAVNGKIYAIGGGLEERLGPLATVEEYNPATDTWTRKADMPTPRHRLVAVVVDGKIYAIGGSQFGNSGALSSMEEYDPATDTWTKKTDMPTARLYHAASAVNGKIYVIGGVGGFSTVEEYDPSTDTWTRKTDMPPRSRFSASAVNGIIYAFGGARGDSTAGLPTVEAYDPATDTWTVETEMPTARGWLSTSTVNGIIYAIGGRPRSADSADSILNEFPGIKNGRGYRAMCRSHDSGSSAIHRNSSTPSKHGEIRRGGELMVENTILKPEERLHFLKTTELFAHVPDGVLGSIQDKMKPIRLPAGTVLFNQGEPGDGLYLILEGEVAIHSDGVQIAIRGPGECVGELAVLDDAPRSAAVTAKTDAVLLKCDRDDFHQIVATSRGVAGALFRMLGQKIREETAQHITIVRQQEQLQQDLRRAHEIQTAMLPGEDLSLDWLHLSGKSQPAAVVGGDYYDYFPLPDGRVSVAIGDVAGHGFYSGLLVATVSSALQFQVERDADPAAVCAVLNQVVQNYHHTRLMMTFAYIVLNPSDRTLTFANAGHPYPCLYRQGGHRWTALELDHFRLECSCRGRQSR